MTMPHTSAYLQAVERLYAGGKATEHSYRPAFKTLLESFGPGIEATNEPKQVACGAPDFIVTVKTIPQGYVEAKTVGVALDKEEKSEQLRRYRASLRNLVLTNYLEFRWYVQDELRLTARLGSPQGKSKLHLEPDGAAEVETLLAQFLAYDEQTIGSPKDLAERMAKLAQVIRQLIGRALADEAAGGKLHQQLQGFREVLIHDLDAERFADMYAQTICYGLFAARCNTRGGTRFTRQQAAHFLPKTNPFLRKLFQHVAGPDLDDEPHAWAVDDLAELLHRTDIAAILADFGKRTRREDPVVHFYETFLAAYDPAMREARGVYYTPEPVVSYIVRSVDHILKTDFKLADGLADASKIKIKSPDGTGPTDAHRVLILDPATGTGTFLYSVINHIYATFRQNLGSWSSYVSQHLLPRLFGFELLMAPYAVAHTKLDLQLRELGYDFKADERLRVYLTNTLEEAHEVSRMPLFTQWLAEEANAASRVKQEEPVMVVLGNPPYSVSSQNKGAWIGQLIESYKKDLNEKKLNLDDDFIKFFRFAQWRIEQTGYGVLAFITNNTYLDGVTHRRMRENLMETFDDIYILNLHGNSKRKMQSPDGSEDKNVFDIQQGVAIGIFIKRSRVKKKQATVRYAELWGKREIYEDEDSNERKLIAGKYHWLWNHSIADTTWRIVDINEPYRFFTPKDFSKSAEYEKEWQVTQIFTISSSGFQTKRDALTIHEKQEALDKVVEDIIALPTEEFRAKYNLPADGRDWTINNAREHVQKLLGVHSKQINSTPCLYRPFDSRLTLFDNKSKGFIAYPRYEVQANMLRPNLALITTRQLSGNDFHHVLVTKEIIDGNTISLQTREYNYLFPLYIYSEDRELNLFNANETSDATGGRRPNLSPEFIADFSERLGLTFIPDGAGDRTATFGPEDVFAYLYAVFHAPAYRTRYAEFLKIDFPRLPLTRNPALFRALCERGAQLVALHLLEAAAPPVASYPVPGDDRVALVRYDADNARVWLNDTQYFAAVPPAVWAFHVGGYQVCQKWLKDRKGRTLAYDDQRHYLQIVAALAETIRLMREIDETITQHGGWPLQ